MHMAALSPDAAEAIAVANGPTVLCRVASAHVPDAMVQQHCCLALFYLAQYVAVPCGNSICHPSLSMWGCFLHVGLFSDTSSWVFVRHRAGLVPETVLAATAAITAHSKDGAVLLAALQALHQSYVGAVACRLHGVETALTDPKVRDAVAAIAAEYDEVTGVGTAASLLLGALENDDSSAVS
jgi:hypothetical protein